MKVLEALNSIDLDTAFRQTLTEMGAEEAEAVLSHDQNRINHIRARMDALAQYHQHCAEERRQVEEFFNNPEATTLEFLQMETPAPMAEAAPAGTESTGDRIAQQQQQEEQQAEQREPVTNGRKGGEVSSNTTPQVRRRRARAGQYTTATELAPVVLTVLQEEGPKDRYSDVQKAVRERLEKEGKLKPQDLKPTGNSKTLRLMSQIAAVRRTLDKNGLIGQEGGKIVVTPAGIQSLKQGSTQQIAAAA